MSERWVTDALDWPTPDDCRTMTPEQAEQAISRYVDQAIAAQILIDHHTARRDRFTAIFRRIAAVHPRAARRVQARSKVGCRRCPLDRPCPHQENP